MDALSTNSLIILLLRLPASIFLATDYKGWSWRRRWRLEKRICLTQKNENRKPIALREFISAFFEFKNFKHYKAWRVGTQGEKKKHFKEFFSPLSSNGLTIHFLLACMHGITKKVLLWHKQKNCLLLAFHKLQSCCHRIHDFSKKKNDGRRLNTCRKTMA